MQQNIEDKRRNCISVVSSFFYIIRTGCSQGEVLRICYTILVQYSNNDKIQLSKLKKVTNNIMKRESDMKMINFSERIRERKQKARERYSYYENRMQPVKAAKTPKAGHRKPLTSTMSKSSVR